MAGLAQGMPPMSSTYHMHLCCCSSSILLLSAYMEGNLNQSFMPFCCLQVDLQNGQVCCPEQNILR